MADETKEKAPAAPLSWEALRKLSDKELRHLARIAKAAENWSAYHNIRLAIVRKRDEA
jgi:hypothetical protein